MLHMRRSRRSTLSLHTRLSAAFGGTTHLSPSGGKQSRIAFPKGRYGMSNSSSKLSCSASLLSTFPSARTKCPSGYREVPSHRSIVTKIFWPSSVGACRVRSRMRGSNRETGVAKTVCWDSDVVLEDVKDVLSM